MMNRAVTGRVLVYDGQCPLCCAIGAACVKLGLFPESGRKPYQDYAGDLAQRLWEAGIRNEILILDPASGELRAGAPGILAMLRSTWIGPLARVLELRPLLDLVSIGYRFIAYNRRFLGVPRPRAAACACDPDARADYLALLIVLFTAFAIAVVTVLGQVAPEEVRLAETRFGVLSPAILTGAGWAALALAGLAVLPAGRKLTYVGHLATTAAVGALILLPLTLAALAVPATVEPRFEGLLQTSLVLSLACTTWLQFARVRYQAIGGAWILGWVAAALLGTVLLGWVVPAVA